ncbi:MAG TPA: glycerophosphodiester phosphodiesterase [Jiangellaceae bacterium]
MEAFRWAASNGYAVETDVRWTKDNQPVLVHDEAATKTLECTQPYNVSETDWSVLRDNCLSYEQAGKRYRIPTYVDAMEALAAIQGAWVYLEVKTDLTDDQTGELLDVIEELGMRDQTVVTSFILDRLAAIEEAEPELRRMLFIDGERIPAEDLGTDGARLWGVAVEQDIVTKDYVQELKDAGVKVVLVWLVDTESAWEKASSVGADKIITRKPQEHETWLGEQSGT